MENSTAILVTLVVYNLLLLGIGFWATGRTHDESEFFLGGRRLGAWVASLSASASSSSAWTLLGVSGAAYLWGLPAIWLIPATVSGFIINWFFVAPRMRLQSREMDAITLTDYLTERNDKRLTHIIRNTASFIVLFSFVFYVASQFQASGKMFHAIFALTDQMSIFIGAAIVVVYIMLGGFWAVSVTDMLQGLLMVGAAVVLPCAALIGVGGFGGLWAGLVDQGSPGLLEWTTGTSAWTGALFIIGLLGIGLGYPGQPHVVNRFMAIQDEKSLRRGKVIAILWAVLIYTGMVILGLCGRVLIPNLADHEQAFFSTAGQLLPPVIAGIVIAAVLSAIMSTVDSQLLVAASCITHDSSLQWKRHSPSRRLLYSRLTVLTVTGLAVWLALGVSEAIFSRVLFAWHALGSAFGPLVLVRVQGRPIRPAYTLAAMVVGFVGTVILNNQPNTPGDIAERYIPFLVSLVIAWMGRVKLNEN